MKAANPKLISFLATLLIGATAAGLMVKQFTLPADSGIVLPALSRRADELRQISDPVQRDMKCFPVLGFGRALDRALPKDATVFLAGMLGKSGASNLGYFYYLKNILFPRPVRISLGDGLVFQEGWFEGTPCDSPEALRAAGVDLLIRFPAGRGPELLPLTQKGVPR